MEDIMSITPLGSGQEVGRSCHLLEFRSMTILLDCGIHPGYDGLNGLPFFDRVEPEQVDVLLISHFHLDHAASLPYFTERTGFKGRIFMTHPTKAVVRLLLGDYLRLMAMKGGGTTSSSQDNTKSGDDNTNSDVLYTDAELQACVDKIELIDYHQTVSVQSLKFHALNAGHVLGAAMFLLEIGGRTILYTGDYSMEDDRHLMAAEIPSTRPDVLIVESTYGVQVHASRQEREARFTGTVERVVTQGGRCLIPVFALGRAQELLLILDEYWHANPKLQSVPIWYASKLASRALRVYQTYANMMNARIRAQMDVSNPFSFKYIKNLKSIDVNSFDDRGPSVVFASPGMLQSGVSRQLFDRWCTDPKNGVLIAGYAVENTLAREIMNQPDEVVSLEGRRQPLNCLVDYVSFSAHVDFMQNRNFISQVDPKHIILVHGQKDEMGRLKSALMLQYKQYPENKRPTVTMPPNSQEVKLRFSRRRSAKVMGSLADRPEELKEGEEVHGILVTQNFSSKIVSPRDLATYTSLRVGYVSSKLHVPFGGTIETLRLFLHEMFEGVTESNDEHNMVKFGLHDDRVNVSIQNARGVATVEWEASPVGDVLADAVIALLLQAQSSAASIRLASKPCRHFNASDRDEEEEPPPAKKRRDDEDSKADNIRKRVEFLHHTLLESFENVQVTCNEIGGEFEIRTDTGLESAPADAAVEQQELVCTVKLELYGRNGTDAKIMVECDDNKLANHVRDCLRSVTTAQAPIPI